MSWTLIIVCICFVAGFFLVRWRMRQDMVDSETLSKMWSKLKDETLEVSLLVSQKCPTNVEAHRLVIEAAQCLVFPKVGPHTIVSAAMIQARYQEGFDALTKARHLAGV